MASARHGFASLAPSGFHRVAYTGRGDREWREDEGDYAFGPCPNEAVAPIARVISPVRPRFHAALRQGPPHRARTTAEPATTNEEDR